MRLSSSVAWLTVACALISASSSADTLRPSAARSVLIARRAMPRGTMASQERAQLDAGETVTRPMVFEKNGGRYIGGVAYQMVRATPEEVLRALSTPAELPRLLPRTKSAKLVGANHESARVELVQGTSVVEATYTVHMKRVGTDEIRFWLDDSRPHGIDDVWGYVRAHEVS